MNVVVRSLHMDSSEALHAYAERRVLFALARVLGAGATALVRISDLNGPRGGIDKRCRISVRWQENSARAEATEEDSYAAIDRACDRIARVLGDDHVRTRERRRRDRWSVRSEIVSNRGIRAQSADRMK